MADDAGSDAAAKMFHLSLGPKHIRLIAADGHEFIVREEIAFKAPTIVAMMKGPALANGVCHLTRIPSHLLSIIVRFLHYKEISPSAHWLRGSPPPSLLIPSSLRADACYAADFLGLVRLGATTDHVRLISADGHEFIMKKDIALEAGIVRAALSGEEIDEVVPVGSFTLRLISSAGRLIDLTEWGRRGQMGRRGGILWTIMNDEQRSRGFDSRVIRLVVHYLIYTKKYKRMHQTGAWVPEFDIPPGLSPFIMAAANFLQC